MTKKKILAHLNHENEYKSFLHNLFSLSSDEYDISAVNFHGNLFEVYHQNKPDIIIGPANEYSQEMHDFITDHAANVKISIFLNVPIKNDEIGVFWNKHKILCVGKRSNMATDRIADYECLYDRLYDDKIFMLSNQTRNNKTAVMLSSDNEINDTVLSDVLYPKCQEKIVLFNSANYQNPQNVGVLSPPDINLVFNSYSYLLDLDNSYNIESQICGIQNISIEGDILENIKSVKLRSLAPFDSTQSSYGAFIKNIFLKALKGN